MGKKRNIWFQIWDWLLEMGLAKAAVVLMTIYTFSAAIVMAGLRWVVQHTK